MNPRNQSCTGDETYKAIHAGLKRRADITRSPKQGFIQQIHLIRWNSLHFEKQIREPSFPTILPFPG